MDLSLSPEILARLVCPVTKKPLHLATEEEAVAWTAPEPFEGVLVTDDASHAYPVREGFPVLVAGEALLPNPSAD
ncbi:MAG: Trm112 family protein [Verrucomicrobiaceae bacterium]|nr:Trm112 family protein [Verrucomicrobiaceae bacterium]